MALTRTLVMLNLTALVHLASSGGITTTNDGCEASLSCSNNILHHRLGTSLEARDVKYTRSR